MIPEFPNFKKLELSDREEIEKITSKHPPYSDFNFTSMWSWDVHQEVVWSVLNGNLVVRFNDYITKEPFFSYFGTNQIDKTADEVIKYAEMNGTKPILKLIPRVSVNNLDKNLFVVEEDISNFDYILSSEKMFTYAGSKLANKRTYARRFLKDGHDFTFELKDLEDKDLHKKIEEVFLLWVDLKQIKAEDTHNEFNALKRFLELSTKPQFFCGLLWVSNKLVGFWLLEDLGDEYVIDHFQKADTRYFTGISAFLMQQTAKAMLEKGRLYINHEQDLGLAGLHTHKQSLDPSYYLRKYIVRRK